MIFETAHTVRPDSYLPLQILTLALQRLGRSTEAESVAHRALALIERHLELNPDDVRALCSGAQKAVRVGDRKRGLAWAKRARTLTANDPAVLYNIACIYALAKEAELAVTILEEAE